MTPRLIFALGTVFVLIIGAFNALFIVHETEQAIVLQFGDPKEVYTKPGLKFKTPFIQDVTYYDSRVLDLLSPPEQVILADQKRIDVNAYARFQIIDPLMFYRTVNNEFFARDRLKNTMNASLRRVLGKVTLSEILSEKREKIIENIRLEMVKGAKSYGIKIFDVRIIRADLPSQTSQAIFNRMRSEREREASEFRAQGTEAAKEIKALADRERVSILADARKQAEIIKGQSDAAASKIYAEAFALDREFYSFYRSVLAYKQAFGAGGGTFFLSPEHDFMRYFKRRPQQSALNGN